MNNYLDSVKKQFEYYKMLGEKTIEQVPDDKLFWQYNEESNSVATIVKHLWGNMLSRWTDFLSTDGEKEWRQRDAEFENDITSRADLLTKWTMDGIVFSTLSTASLTTTSIRDLYSKPGPFGNGCHQSTTFSLSTSRRSDSFYWQDGMWPSMEIIVDPERKVSSLQRG
jgi:hypothetical protein